MAFNITLIWMLLIIFFGSMAFLYAYHFYLVKYEHDRIPLEIFSNSLRNYPPMAYVQFAILLAMLLVLIFYEGLIDSITKDYTQLIFAHLALSIMVVYHVALRLSVAAGCTMGFIFVTIGSGFVGVLSFVAFLLDGAGSAASDPMEAVTTTTTTTSAYLMGEEELVAYPMFEEPVETNYLGMISSTMYFVFFYVIGTMLKVIPLNRNYGEVELHIRTFARCLVKATPPLAIVTYVMFGAQLLFLMDKYGFAFALILYSVSFYMIIGCCYVYGHAEL